MSDETAVKANRKRYYVFSAVDVERKGLIPMGVYTTRNYLTAKYFMKEVLSYCKNKPKFCCGQRSLAEKARNLSENVALIIQLIQATCEDLFCSITAKKPVVN